MHQRFVDAVAGLSVGTGIRQNDQMKQPTEPDVHTWRRSDVRFKLLLGCVSLVVGACSSGGQGAAPSEPNSTTSSLPSMSSATQPFASAEFCSAARLAAEGNFDYTSPTAPQALSSFEGLTDPQRAAVEAAVRETAADVMNDGPDFTQWTNESMIEMINAFCGTQLAPSNFVS